MTDRDRSNLGQLRWQCRRGMLELDFVLERYLNDLYATADHAEQQLFRQLLTAQDPELQLWLLNGQAHPDPAWQRLIDRIRMPGERQG
ncbi:MAG: succinate dehydrogenase assembly factor 2 [Chromatiaceae bacterium]|nr:succinate dehydrogenase assembly factor 2 [Chromatiaceae bacterium]